MAKAIRTGEDAIAWSKVITLLKLMMATRGH